MCECTFNTGTNVHKGNGRASVWDAKMFGVAAPVVCLLALNSSSAFLCIAGDKKPVSYISRISLPAGYWLDFASGKQWRKMAMGVLCVYVCHVLPHR